MSEKLSSEKASSENESGSGDDDGDDQVVPKLGRNEVWLEERRLHDAESMKLWFVKEKNMKVELDQCLRTSSLGGIKPIHLLIASYAIPRQNVWLAERRLLSVLQPPVLSGGFRAHNFRNNSIDELLANVPEDELVDIEQQVSSWDPADEDRPRYVYEKRTDIRFHPQLEACNGCNRLYWMAIRSVKGQEKHSLTRSIGKSQIGPDSNYTMYFVCQACETFCMCTPVKLHMYKQSCTICHHIKCQKHDYTTYLKNNPFACGYPQRLSNPSYQCELCLRTLELGHTLSTILAHPNPHSAFADYHASKLVK
jgi:hypothetical protein